MQLWGKKHRGSAGSAGFEDPRIEGEEACLFSSLGVLGMNRRTDIDGPSRRYLVCPTPVTWLACGVIAMDS